MNYKEKLDALHTEVREKISIKIRQSKDESEYFSNKKVIKVDEKRIFNLEGGGYLTEISEIALLDDLGHTYGYSALTPENLMDLADWVINKETKDNYQLNNLYQINEVKVEEELFDEQMTEYRIIDVETEIDSLEKWIGEGQSEHTEQLMREDLRQLQDCNIEYVLSSNSTNHFVEPGSEEFDNICTEILEENTKLLISKARKGSEIIRGLVEVSKEQAKSLIGLVFGISDDFESESLIENEEDLEDFSMFGVETH